MFIFTQISLNGLITFQSEWFFFSSHIYFPAGLKAIAPFWSDVDTSPSFETNAQYSNDEIGNVWYRQETNSELLQRSGQEIRNAFIDHPNFSPTWLMIITWDRVGYFYRHIDKVYDEIIYSNFTKVLYSFRKQYFKCICGCLLKMKFKRVVKINMYFT